MKIAITGSTGLVGSAFLESVRDTNPILEVGSKNNINITNRAQVLEALESFAPELIVHFAAKTNVDACETDKEADSKIIEELGIRNGNTLTLDRIEVERWHDMNTAFAINVVGTAHVVEYVAGTDAKLIHISTDFIFDGEKEFYTEEDQANPINWYGMTKYWAEEVVKQIDNYVIARLAFPYGFQSNIKKDFVWKLKELMETREAVSLITNQFFTPTFIPDIVGGVNFLKDKNASGIYHLVGNQTLTPYEAGQKIKDGFHLSTTINETTREDIYAGKAPRPFKLFMKHDKLSNLGFQTKSFDDGLSEIIQTQ